MINLIHGDCLEKMKDIPNNSIDFMVTSPPYNIGKNYDESIDIEKFILNVVNKISLNGVIAWQVGNRINNGFIDPIDIIYHHIFITQGFKLLNRIIWTFNHGLHCKNRLSGRYETICIYVRNNNYTFNLDQVRVPQKYPNKKHYKGLKKGLLSGNPLGKNPSDVWEITNVKANHPEKTIHPCQYPQELCNRLIKLFTNKEDLVFDPFMGSGTTGIVAKKLERKFIGIEKDETYFNLAKNRIENVS